MPILMSDHFAVRCRSCQFTWNTPAMAEGLKVLGSCPKCKGGLEFGALAAAAPVADVPDASGTAAPHLVLGIPRI
ncbi:MAG: hypothetical protein JWR30_2815 [Conexibacter sp.]|jgi:hypothetical protein|nr:hypothetical protein [Conexibacter sp.]MCZ4493739.1 hypothetical protein [Conexibacter sp.]MDX6716044.1 hypothetical protein [Baekduia sp.]MDX6731508.1 hypothetical protein [Baekduia sp.]